MMFKYMCLVLFITWYQLADCHPARSDEKSIDSMIDKESEAFLSVEANESSQKTVRDKRTIGFLRQLFPNFSQMVDRKIQQITRFVFRVIGRLVLRGGAPGGAAAGAGAGAGGAGAAAGGESGGGRRISITLPTFPPSMDDEDEDQTDAPVAATSEPVESRLSDAADGASSTSTAASADSVAAASADSSADTAAVTTEAPAAVTTTADATTTTTTTTTTAASTKAEATSSAAAVTTNSPTTQSPLDSDNALGTVMKRTAREASTENTSSTQKRSPLTDTENNDVSSDNALQNTNDDAQVETDEDPRNKRFLFNLRGGGDGGSGNFLFDLIRLVAGSGANQDRDESADATPLETETQEVRADLNGKEDGYSVGVPGPLTRIFVIANRGVANLVQDLILRLAQTTERIVNFKARLITSLI